MRRVSIALLVLFVFVAGCASNSIAPSDGVPFTVTDLTVGTGDFAMNGQLLTVHFTGWLYAAGTPENKGFVVDTTVGRQPFTFTLGAGEVIQGWDEGLVGMRVGGKRRLVVPPELAFGEQGLGNDVPPNATLIFEVDLINLQ